MLPQIFVVDVQQRSIIPNEPLQKIHVHSYYENFIRNFLGLGKNGLIIINNNV
jgi:hypothetical protein